MINDSAACSADSLLLSRQRQKQIHTVRKTQTDSEKHTHTDRQRQIHTVRKTQTDSEKHTHRQTDTWVVSSLVHYWLGDG